MSLARASSSSSSSVKLSNGYEQKINTNSYSQSYNRSTPKYHRNQHNHLVNHSGSHVNDDNNDVIVANVAGHEYEFGEDGQPQ